MKKFEIFYNELTPVTEMGNRETVTHECVGTFEKRGMAYLVLKLLKENAYNNLINVDTATSNERMIFLSLES